MANLLEELDAQVAHLLSDWTMISTLLALTIAALLIHPILYPSDPDTHPLLLARQSAISPVRHKNSSAIYRSPETPYGAPLKTGLNVKDVGAPRWKAGRDGDLRDVWREVQRGGMKYLEGSRGGDGNGNGKEEEIPRGGILTVLGREEVVEHKEAELSREIGILGRHLKGIGGGGGKVAIYLPNSVEYLMAVFACSFYGLTPILLPYNLPHAKIYELLTSTSATSLICAAGSLPLEDLAKECPRIRLLTWVVEKTSRHMDWNGVPDFAQTRLTVSVWHDIVDENKEKSTSELPSNEAGDKPGAMITISQPNDLSNPPEITTFTQSNLVSALGALISALPLRQRFSPADLVLPAHHFHIPYVLLQTFAALYMHASLAITSVAQPGVDFALAQRSVSPTVIVASAETLAEMHERETAGVTSPAQKIGMYAWARALEAGRMPKEGLLSRFLAPSSRSAAGNNKPGALRLILVPELLGMGTPALSSTMLSDLRIFTRARICYALCASGAAAGAVAQTGVFDYRRRDDGGKYSHFGVPVSSVEVWVVGEESARGVGGREPVGEIVVRGPAVVVGGGGGGKDGMGEVKLGVRGMFGEDGTLNLLV